MYPLRISGNTHTLLPFQLGNELLILSHWPVAQIIMGPPPLRLAASTGGGGHAADSYPRTTATGVLIDSIPKEIEEEHNKDEQEVL